MLCPIPDVRCTPSSSPPLATTSLFNDSPPLASTPNTTYCTYTRTRTRTRTPTHTHTPTGPSSKPLIPFQYHPPTMESQIPRRAFNVLAEPFYVDQSYEFVKELGQGAYGCVVLPLLRWAR